MDWDSRYNDYGHVFGDRPTPFLHDVFPTVESALKRPLRILCPGDGYGRNGLWLARRGHTVEGVDLSSLAVKMANEQAQRERLDYRSHTGDLSSNEYSLREKFDGIAHLWCRLETRRSRIAWNRKACAALGEDGFVILTTSTRLTTLEEELSEWPHFLKWEIFNSGEELRLLGRSS